jgi:hypothetical protein
VKKKKDPLAAAVKREELRKAEEEAKKCKHPHLHFQNFAHRLRCVDCKRHWIAGLKVNGQEFNISDAGYWNPDVLDTEFRHSPSEAPRIAPVPKKPEKSKK